MPETPNKPKLDTLQRAFIQLENLQTRLKSYESEPIAIIGMGCRFPGNVQDADSYWDLLQHGRDAIREVPPDRWDVDAYFDPDPEAPGKMVTRWGAFLNDIDLFDPQLFAISPREAVSMDPQQRLLLEVVWEALEDAGQASDKLSGSRTGVFVGIIGSEYGRLMTAGEGIRQIDTYFGSGVASSVATGRVSYIFGLQGPSLAIDTSCSSSLVAVHLAVQSLRNRECRMALAGGVNLMLLPDTTVILSKHKLMAADGRCKTFDQSADGYVRGEGCGMVVLKRLSDATADGDRILALIRGIAANQDGPSSGLTAPHGPAQQAVIRAALANGAVDPLNVGYIETHGTGTALGDPIEIQALSAVYGKGRPANQPIYVGAVKTNIGHLEAAAGIASLLKAVMVLRKRAIPPHLNMLVPNSHIPWNQLPIKVPAVLTGWPNSSPALAGVSSFGFSGTNVHLILQTPDAQTPPPVQVDRPRHLLCLSARNAAALNALLQRYRDHLEKYADLAPGDVGFSANTGRAALSQRLAICYSSLDDLRGRLAEAASGMTSESVFTGICETAEPPRVACLFGGDFAQVDMVRDLFETQPVFRAALKECRDALLSHQTIDLLEALYPSGGESGGAEERLHNPVLGFPALYAVQAALLSLWRSWGVSPTAVAGQGPGEVTAAYAAGVIGLEEGLKLVCALGRFPSPTQNELTKILDPSRFSDPQIHLIAASTGKRLGRRDFTDPSFWNRPWHTAEPLDGATRSLRNKGYRLFLEIGRPLQFSGTGAQDPAGGDIRRVSSLGRGARHWDEILGGLAQLYIMGVPIDWAGFEKPYTRRRVALPTYPFQRRRYWAPSAVPQKASRDPQKQVHPLLGRRIPSALPEVQFENSLGMDDFEFIDDHKVNRQTIVPATAFIEMAAAAMRLVTDISTARLADFIIHRPLLIEAGKRCWVQTIVSPSADGTRHFKIFSCNEAEADSWTVHVSGRLDSEAPEHLESQPVVSPEELKNRCPEEIPGSRHYEELARRGFQFGPALQGVVKIHRGHGEALGRIRLPESAKHHMRLYGFHPALLDACLQFFWTLLPQEDSSTSFLPISFERVAVFGDPPSELWSHIVFRPVAKGSEGQMEGDVKIYTADGRPVAAIDRLIFRRANLNTFLAAVPDRIQDWLYHLHWEPLPSRTPVGKAPETDGPHRTSIESLERVCAHIEAAMPALLGKHDLESHHRFVLSLNALSAAYIREAFEKLGVAFTPGCRLNLEELVGGGAVQQRYRRLLQRYAHIMTESGLLNQTGGGWEVMRGAAGDAAAMQLERLLNSPGGAASAQLELVSRCGPRLAEALAGRTDPLALLFPGGNLALAARLYSESPEAAVYNSLVSAAVQEALRTFPPGRKARILELGAGTGGATSYVLPDLDAARVEYVFTDISPMFLKQATKRFDKYAFVQYRLCNIEQGPRAQSFDGQSFDIVIAMNMLHATRDLKTSLQNIHEFLRPGGLLILLEGTAPEPWIDITFGLTDGWWAFSDIGLRPDYPLLSRKEWLDTLRDCGYAETAAAPNPTDLSPEALIMARRSETPERRSSAAERWWMVVDGGSGLDEELVRRLKNYGIACLQVTPGERCAPAGELHWTVRPERAEDYGRVFAEAAGKRKVEKIIQILPAGAGLAAEADLTDLYISQARVSKMLLYAMQALLKAQTWSRPPDLCIATCGALATDPRFVPQIVQAPVWGICRVMGLEHPDIALRCIDLDPNASAVRNAEDLLEILFSQDAEEIVALRDGRQWVPRLKHAPESAGPTRSRAADDSPMRLRKTATGVLDELQLEAVELPEPGPGEVQIHVYSAGLSFRDVMNALSMRDDPDPLGSECSGRIVKTGHGVTAFACGDEVIALAAGSIGTYVNTRQAYVVHKPHAMSFEEAATLPTAFLTAYYALLRKSALQPGERVLIHAAAGGVGMAAVQLSLAAGAEVFGTAGSTAKRDYLHQLGVKTALDSRSTAFADEITRLTGGRGVDVVLNSLAGEFIYKNLSVLAPGGRFLEIGKRDILTPGEVQKLRPDVEYHVIDLAATTLTDPEMIHSLFSEIVRRMADGTLKPLPSRAFSMSQAPDAFRFMSQSKHIGKVVLKNDRIFDTPPRIRDDASYLVTGGLSGLGLLTAKWLADRGAKHLALLARKPAGSEAMVAISALRQAGVNVHCLQADIGSPEQSAAALGKIRDCMPPLKGVFHLAGVLADGVLINQSWERFETVCGPKIYGAWNLHRLTRDAQLDLFVLFSSTAGLFGSPGQSNHAAANAFLDSLAHYRRASGLPALSINWGVWSQVGAAAQKHADERVVLQGVGVISPAAGIQALERVIESGAVQMAVVPIDWGRFLKTYAGGVRPAWLADFAAEQARESFPLPRKAADDDQNRGAGFEALPAGQRRKALVRFVQEQTARVLGLPDAAELDLERPLNEQGVDSLISVELRNVLAKGSGLQGALPATLVFDYPSIEKIAAFLYAQMTVKEEHAPPVRLEELSIDSRTDDLIDAIGRLSDEDADRLLRKQEEGL